MDEDPVETLRAMERSASLHESLTRLVLSGGDTSAAAEMLAAELGMGVAVLDRDDQVVAVSGHIDVADFARADGAAPPRFDSTGILACAMEQTRRTGRCVTSGLGDGRRASVVAVSGCQSYFGGLVLAHDRSLTAVDLRCLEHAAQIIGLITLTRDAVVEAETGVRGELLTALLTSAQRPTQDLVDRARARGVDLGELTVLLVVEATARHRVRIRRHLDRVAEQWHGLAGDHRGMATLVLPGRDAGVATKEIHDQLRAELGIGSLVVGTDVLPPEPWAHAFTVARRCAQILTRLGSWDRWATTQDLAMYGMVFDPDRTADLNRFLDDTLGALIDYDASRNAELIKTLAAYFQCSGNLTRTSAALHVHPNTLLKRLGRIGTLIGEDWQEPEPALRLHLAVRMFQLALDLGVDRS